ncbi:MAG: MmcQ/YjbR family DNA-binding protein [Pseudomonadota bacterium]
MVAEFVETQCRALPGAIAERPFGPDTVVWTIGGRMFAAYTAEGTGVSVACHSALVAQRLVRERRALSAPYLRGPGWVLLPFETTALDELNWRIRQSYLRVRRTLSDEIALGLPPMVDLALP